MSTGLIYLHRTTRGVWEVSHDQHEWALFPHMNSGAGEVIDEARRMFSRQLVAISGPPKSGSPLEAGLVSAQ